MTTYKGTLTKQYSLHTNLRTDSMEGVFNQLPQLHYSFSIYGESLDPNKDFRSIVTSPITEINKNENIYEFRTLNSIYTLTIEDVQEKA